MTLLWRSSVDRGQVALSGNCGASTEGWCNPVFRRPEQIRLGAAASFGIPTSPQGNNVIRLEVKFGDQYVKPGPNGYAYSGSRATLSGPDALWFKEGDERWLSCPALLPAGSTWAFPKHDELARWNAADPTTGKYLDGGAVMHIHHQPAAGGIEEGSAPLYLSGDGKRLRLSLAGPKTVQSHDAAPGQYVDINAPYLTYDVPIRFGEWMLPLLHIKFSHDPTVGFVEGFESGAKFCDFKGATLYKGMQGYLIGSLYRHQSIGDPSLKFADGSRVFPQDDGTPGVAYLGDWRLGTSRADVEVAPVTDPVVVTPPLVPVKHPALDLLIDLRVQLVKEIAALQSIGILVDATVGALELLAAEVKTLLDRGEKWDAP